jgi:hypothetical protein
VFMPQGRWQLVIRSGGAGLLLLLSGLAQTVAAQVRSPVEAISFGTSECRPVIIPASECFRQADAPSWRIQNFATRAPDHRYEGLALGAVLGAVGAGLLGAVVCAQADDANQDCTKTVIGVGLLGGALGGLTGLLIGAQFPKEPKTAPADSTAQ